MSTTLVITRAAVHRDGRPVARLLWSGRCLKVESLRGKALGRLLPAGYHEGRPDDGSGTYDLWTAKHPHVHVPSDTIVAPSVTMARGIALALEGVLASATARLRPLLPVRGAPCRLVGLARHRHRGGRRNRLGHRREPRQAEEEEITMAVGEIASLPVWAQKYIAELAGDAARAQQTLEEWKARNAVGMEDSTVIADPYSEAPRPMGRDTMVRYVSPEVSFSVEFDSAEGMLTVTATGHKARRDGIAVYPSTGNGIRIKGGRP